MKVTRERQAAVDFLRSHAPAAAERRQADRAS
jgi:hypothetical protein